ncbi:MAG: single-stranded DNA-binding protein [bacterium]|nr:single-stranded DNA-binding protein [bacterium]MDZ4284293.1 single-stranded DNA-binding protein [Patescibacteria group bacterium]
MYLNKIFLIGNLTRDPELRAIPSGVQVATFGLATNRVWRDSEGNKKEGVEFHNIVVFGRQGELVAQYLRKGSSALIEGRIQTRSWDGQDGQKRYRTEIVAERVQFGPRPGYSGGGGEARQGSSVPGTPQNGHVSQQAASAAPRDEAIPAIQYPEEEVNPEDIPF